ncbi:amidohydrolase family protein [Serratia ficaria]|uniref:amidohydrolase family protein n=1 Tax=Serratia ficaria TaxID=61651 RepID=UPI0021831A45|nr:amidohydrolase family protein [Serratia ficaria]CAI2535254.1 Predicted metal-dependent hydrolase of the TIM-barrel fold [Serratia ficaria]
MKIICLEEHYLDSELGQACMPVALEQAPFLGDWGKTVADGHNPDRSRPQIEKNAQINQKGVDLGSRRLSDMDEAGITMQIISVGGFPQLTPEHEAVTLNTAANDRLAGAVSNHPEHFAAFATLPWAQPKEAEKELVRTVEELGFKGALLNGRPSSCFLDHPDYDSLLSRFNKLNVPLYLHPGLPFKSVQQAYFTGFSAEVNARLSMFGWGWHHEAGIHLLRLMLSGAFDKYPHLQVISGHWGEMLPFWLQRLDDSLPLAATGLSRTLTRTFKEHVYVTPSGMLTLPHFKFIYELMGADRILFSVDYPYQTLDGVKTFIDSLPVNKAEKEAFAFRNAARLLDLTV